MAFRVGEAASVRASGNSNQKESTSLIAGNGLLLISVLKEFPSGEQLCVKRRKVSREELLVLEP